MLILPWYIVIAIALSGALIAVLLINPIKGLYRNFRVKTPVIKKYWPFVMPYAVLVSIAYALLYRYSAPVTLSNNINVLGQIVTLIFAIFVGYFAFLQVVEYRKDKLKEEGIRYLKDKSYSRAARSYQQICSIDQKSFDNWSELEEVYLLQKDYQSFDSNIASLTKNVIEVKDRLIVYYLLGARYLIGEHLSEGRVQILQTVQYAKEHEGIPARIWDFSDMTDSHTYKTLSGEAKTILDNFIRYLSNQLDPEQRTKFESGNYALN